MARKHLAGFVDTELSQSQLGEVKDADIKYYKSKLCQIDIPRDVFREIETLFLRKSDIFPDMAAA
jgi:hypothetical protein